MASQLPKELIQQLVSGQISSQSLTEHYIAEIKKHASLNALCVDCFDNAQSLAKERDLKLTGGDPLAPLHGLPITVKECFDVSGLPTTIGIANRHNDIPQHNDMYVNGLLDAGAVLLGKTNVSQLLAFIETDNPIYGVTKHPLNPAYSCGGSSGGEGALVGEGLSPLGLGTDIGGSVRIPAAVNGACAIKPTAMRIKDKTRYSQDSDLIPVKSTVGPLSQDAHTLSIALQVLNNVAKHHWPVEPLRDYRDIDVSQLNIGYFVDDGIFPVSAPVRQGIEHAVKQLKDLGATLTEYRFPALDVAEKLFYQSMSLNNGKVLFDALRGDKPAKQLKLLHKIAPMPKSVKRAIASVLSLFGQQHESRILRYMCKDLVDEPQVLEDKISQYVETVLQSLANSPIGQLDAVISPILPVPAYLTNSFEQMGLAGTYSLINNVTGFPAGVSRVGTSDGQQTNEFFSRIDRAERRAFQCASGSSGLPLATQITALPWREDVVLALIDVLHRNENVNTQNQE